MTKQVRQAITPTHVLGSTGTAEGDDLGFRALGSFTCDIQGLFRGAGAIATNTAVGASALAANTTGCQNTAIGGNALLCNTTGNLNTAVGFDVLPANTTGCFNVAMGRNALFSNTTGTNNIGIGYLAGRAGLSPLVITTQSNAVVIGNNDSNCFVAGCAWQTSSDCRDKTDIGSPAYGLDFVLALQPVEYKWDKRSRYGWDEETQSYLPGDGSKKDARCSLGFLAQQVLEVEKQFAPDRNSIIVSDDDPLNLNLGETHIIPALVKAMQELTARVEALENA